DRPFLGSTRTQHTVSNAFSAIASSRSRSPAIAHACTEHGRIYSFGVATLLTRRIATYVLLLKCNVAGSVASAARAVARVIPYSHENIRPVCVVPWFVISAANAISFSLTLNGKAQACITAGNI